MFGVVFALVTWVLRDAYWMVAAVAGLAAACAAGVWFGAVSPAGLSVPPPDPGVTSGRGTL